MKLPTNCLHFPFLEQLRKSIIYYIYGTYGESAPSLYMNPSLRYTLETNPLGSICMPCHITIMEGSIVVCFEDDRHLFFSHSHRTRYFFSLNIYSNHAPRIMPLESSPAYILISLVHRVCRLIIIIFFSNSIMATTDALTDD